MPSRGMAPLLSGSIAPGFSFDDEFGRPHRLADLLGHPIILIFAAPGQGSIQPVMQQLTIEGERVLVLSPTDEALAGRAESEEP
jgi:hypothetical protein